MTTPGRGTDELFGDKLSELIGKRFGHLWTQLPRAADPSDVKAVHDIRVASRRLRAAMDVGVDCFPASWYAPLHTVAKDITSSLGEVRDREVLLAYLASDEGVSPEEAAGIDRLVVRLTDELAAARREMTDFLARVEASGARDESIRRFGRQARPKDMAVAPAVEAP